MSSIDVNKTATEKAATIGVAIACIITFVLSENTFSLWSSIIGVTLLLLLFAYDTNERVSFMEQTAFSFIAALCIILAVGSLLTMLYGLLGLNNLSFVLPGTQIRTNTDLFTFILWLIAVVCMLLTRNRTASSFSGPRRP